MNKVHSEFVRADLLLIEFHDFEESQNRTFMIENAKYQEEKAIKGRTSRR